MIILLTGQPSSGKTTIAEHLRGKYLTDRYVVVDGDIVRKITGNDSSYGHEARLKSMEVCFNIASFIHEVMNKTPIIAMVSPYKFKRDTLKARLPVAEVFLTYDKNEDTRGKENYHYEQYEAPTENFLHIDTTNKSVEECANHIEEYVEKLEKAIKTQRK